MLYLVSFLRLLHPKLSILRNAYSLFSLHFFSFLSKQIYTVQRPKPKKIFKN